MKLMSKFTIALFITCFIIHPGWSQQRNIKGSVSTFKSLVVIGATIEVNSTGQKVLSDSLGFFEVTVVEKDKIKVSASGFKTTKVKINQNTSFAEVDLKIKQTENALDEAVNMGHIQNREHLISVIQLDNKDLDFSRYNSMYDVIGGRFPNVEIQANGDIIIRGKNSLAQSDAALVVIDGVVTDNSALNNVAPSSVKSIHILKGSEAARYGSRGANGIVEVKTLRGGEK